MKRLFATVVAALALCCISASAQAKWGKNEDRRSNISYSPHTDINIRLIVLKFGMDMFLRNISALTKYGPDRTIFRYSPHINLLFEFFTFILCCKNYVYHS